MLHFWCLLLLASAGIVIKPAQSSMIPRSSSSEKDIFILAGQSNMAGRGGVIGNKWDGVVPSQCQPNPSILRLSSQLQWEEAREPLHADIDVYATVGVGPGMSFANAVRHQLKSSIGVIGLVPCAVGNTKISEWGRGTNLYNQFLKRSKAAVNGGGRIRAILWYQGESDTINRADADRYSENLKKLIEDMRADLQLPSVPFIQVALPTAQGPFKEIVRKAQLELNLPNVWCVDGKGLRYGPDYVHLTTHAQVNLGKMLAKAFIDHVHQ